MKTLKYFLLFVFFTFNLYAYNNTYFHGFKNLQYKELSIKLFLFLLFLIFLSCNIKFSNFDDKNVAFRYISCTKCDWQASLCM